MQPIQGDFRETDPFAFALIPQAGREDRDPALPPGAAARIWKPSPSALTAGRAGARGWKMRFLRRSPPRLEPLMGWTAGSETVQQGELEFPRLEAAIRHAERLGIGFEVHPPAGAAGRGKRVVPALPAGPLADDAPVRLDLCRCRAASCGPMAGARDDGGLPMDVVGNPCLTREVKRAVLRDRAWTEYLQELASSEGMPEHGRPSRLAGIGRALLALEAAGLRSEIAAAA